MPKGLSLHIGLNKVDPKHYDGWDGRLNACEADAESMFALAKRAGFSPTKLLTAKARTKTVKSAIAAAALSLQAGDIFFLSYSGHGGQVPDTNGDDAEDDMDETWVLYDRQLIDDELYDLWGKFAPGVRIVMLSDSCHSGTVSRVALFDRMADAGMIPQPTGYRGMDERLRKRVYQKNKREYDDVQKEYRTGERVSVGASVMLISGCQDAQLSLDGEDNGLFTGTLLSVWNNGSFKGGYRKFHKKIQGKMPPSQQPNLFLVGAKNLAFERQKPFTI